MFELRRTKIAAGTPLRILVDLPDETSSGMTFGGAFYFAPTGEPGDRAVVSEQVARAIMNDPGMAPMFTCIPQLDEAQPADAGQAVKGGRTKKQPEDAAGP